MHPIRCVLLILAAVLVVKSVTAGSQCLVAQSHRIDCGRLPYQQCFDAGCCFNFTGIVGPAVYCFKPGAVYTVKIIPSSFIDLDSEVFITFKSLTGSSSPIQVTNSLFNIGSNGYSIFVTDIGPIISAHIKRNSAGKGYGRLEKLEVIDPSQKSCSFASDVSSSRSTTVTINSIDLQSGSSVTSSTDVVQNNPTVDRVDSLVFQGRAVVSVSVTSNIVFKSSCA